MNIKYPLHRYINITQVPFQRLSPDITRTPPHLPLPLQHPPYCTLSPILHLIPHTAPYPAYCTLSPILHLIPHTAPFPPYCTYPAYCTLSPILHLIPHITPYPSIIGVMTVHPSLTGRTIVLRESNTKFESPHPHLCFVKGAGNLIPVHTYLLFVRCYECSALEQSERS